MLYNYVLILDLYTCTHIMQVLSIMHVSVVEVKCRGAKYTKDQVSFIVKFL